MKKVRGFYCHETGILLMEAIEEEISTVMGKAIFLKKIPGNKRLYS